MAMGILEILFGGSFAVLAVMTLVKRTIPTIRAIRKGARAQGKVLRLRAQNLRGQVIHRPVVEFTTAAGSRVEYIDPIAPQMSVQPGDVVTVYYDPANPNNTATLASGGITARFAVVGVLMVLFFGAVCVGGFFVAFGGLK